MGISQHGHAVEGTEQVQLKASVLAAVTLELMIAGVLLDYLGNVLLTWQSVAPVLPWPILGVRVLAVPVAAWGLAVVGRRLSRRSLRPLTAVRFQVACCLPLLPVLLCSVVLPWVQNPLSCELLYHPVLVALLVLWLELPDSLPITPVTLAWNALLALVLVEVILRVAAATNRFPILWNKGVEPAVTVATFRARPGAPSFDGHFNSLGYLDDEFTPGGEVVALVGDSQLIPPVPPDLNAVTLAEKRVRQTAPRMRLHNFGITCTGPAEYLYLLRSEVESYRPTMVVVSIYVGNDVLPVPLINRLTDSSLQEWRLGLLVRRLLRISKRPAARTPKFEPHRGQPRPASVADWRLERPIWTDEQLMKTEREYVEAARTPPGPGYQQTFTLLAEMQKLLGPRLKVMVCPDLYQLDDRIFARLGGGLEREMPQELVGRFCREKGIPYLDLLPVLREAQAKRRQPVFHRGDHHWNRAGNEAVAEALSAFILEQRASR